MNDLARIDTRMQRTRVDGNPVRRRSTKVLVKTNSSNAKIELDDFRGISVEVAETYPGRTRPYVRQARPLQSLAPFRKPQKVEFLQLLELFACWLVRHPFILHSTLVAIHQPADYERDGCVLSQVGNLPGRIQRVEEEFEIISNDEADYGRLRRNRSGN